MISTKFPELRLPKQTLTELSDFSLDLHQSLVDQGFAKSLDRSTLKPWIIKRPDQAFFLK